MSEAAKVSGGDPSDIPSGSEGNGNEGKTDVVSYSTYQKVLTEKKNVSERLKALEAERNALMQEKEEQEKTQLEAQNKFKELYEKTKKDLESERGSKQSIISDIVKQRKIAAFLGAVGGSVDRDYHLFIDTESILEDPETGELDEMSVTKEVERFMKKHPLLVQRPHEKRTTSVYPNGEASSGNTIRYSDWRKLSSKEMKKWAPSQIID